MNDLLSALKEQVKLWFTTTGQLLRDPSAFANAHGKHEGTATHFNPHYYLAVGLFVAFQFLFVIAANTANYDSAQGQDHVTKAANDVLASLNSSSFAQIIIPMLLPFGLILLCYWGSVWLLYRQHPDARRAQMHMLLYYGALCLLVPPFVLFTINLMANRLLQLGIPLMAEDVFSSMLGWGLAISVLLIAALVVYAIAAVHRKSDADPDGPPRRLFARWVLYPVLLPLPLLVMLGFLMRDGAFARKQTAMQETPRVHACPARANRATKDCRLMSFELDPEFSRGQVDSTRRFFTSDRIHCYNAGKAPLLLNRQDTVFCALMNGKSRTDARGPGTEGLTFIISSWQSPEEDFLLLPPGESRWVRLTLDEATINKAMLSQPNWLCARLRFVPFSDDESEAEPSMLDYKIFLN